MAGLAATLAGIAGRLVASLPDHDLPPTLAVGTVHELADVADRVGDAALLVLTPVAPGQISLLHGIPAIATVASLAAPTPASTITGTRDCSTMRRIITGF